MRELRLLSALLWCILSGDHNKNFSGKGNGRIGEADVFSFFKRRSKPDAAPAPYAASPQPTHAIAQIPEPFLYSVFTRKHDIEIDASDLSSSGEVPEKIWFRKQLAIRNEYDIALLARRAKLISSAIARAESLLLSNNLRPLEGLGVSILLDHSGSLRNGPAVTSRIVAETLEAFFDRLGCQLEVLGFTTTSWRGGRARTDWIAAGKPANPGRLCDLLHIVYRSFDHRTKANLSPLLDFGILKENVDGEALEWAAGRLSAAQLNTRLLLFVSDGAPCDDSTLAANKLPVLVRHRNQVLKGIVDEGKMAIGAINLSEMATLPLEHQVTVSRVVAIDPVVLDFAAGLVSDSFRKHGQDTASPL